MHSAPVKVQPLRNLPGAGRVFALEMAAYVVAQTGSSLWGGYMFDDLRLSPRGVSLLMIAPSAVVTVRLCPDP